VLEPCGQLAHSLVEDLLALGLLCELVNHSVVLLLELLVVALLVEDLWRQVPSELQI